MVRPLRIAILGSTGSIGRQALEVIDDFPDRFQVTALACARSGETIATQARKYAPKLAAVVDSASAKYVAETLKDTPVQVGVGMQAVVQCALLPEVDVVLAAATGVAGLLPVYEAVRSGKRVALANKEPLVVAGHLLIREAEKSGAKLIPVDSEHSAIFQALLGQDRSAVRRVVLTASGGTFRDTPSQELARVTPEQALAHPTWKMGPKVTIDSATLMNKGLELIEARWLFDLRPEQLDILLHPESIVHSLVEFIDGSMIAQLARPDMRIPIQFALSFPVRLSRPEPPPDLARLGSLTFKPFEVERWSCVRLAREALAVGGTAPAALNAADEVAVSWFLDRKIRFDKIPSVIEWSLNNSQIRAGETMEELLEVDHEIRSSLEKRRDKWT